MDKIRLEYLLKFLMMSLFLTAGISVCKAQIYIYVREDQFGVQKLVDMKDGYAKITEKVKKLEGTWTLLLESDKEGYGYIACVSDVKKGILPKYFVTSGHPTKETAKKKQEEANSYAYLKGVYSVPCGGLFYNSNKYPIVWQKPKK